jgi:hypothetical protein
MTLPRIFGLGLLLAVDLCLRMVVDFMLIFDPGTMLYLWEHDIAKGLFIFFYYLILEILPFTIIAAVLAYNREIYCLKENIANILKTYEILDNLNFSERRITINSRK